MTGSPSAQAQREGLFIGPSQHSRDLWTRVEMHRAGWTGTFNIFTYHRRREACGLNESVGQSIGCGTTPGGRGTSGEFAVSGVDFEQSGRVEDYRARIRAFVAGHVMPLEADPAVYDEHENIRLDRLDELRVRAKAEGLWCLQLPPAHGGQGLGFVGMAACYEEMNRSIFGPAVVNLAAPDDGNMMLLAKVA